MTMMFPIPGHWAIHLLRSMGKFSFETAAKRTEAGGTCDPEDPPFPGFELFGKLTTPQGDCFCVWTNDSQTAFTRCQ